MNNFTIFNCVIILVLHNLTVRTVFKALVDIYGTGARFNLLN